MICSRRLLVLSALVFAFGLGGCKCDTSLESDPSSPLAKFKNERRKKKRRHARTSADSPPTKEQGRNALAEAQALLEEAEFAQAEEELKIAAAAGVGNADELLVKVRAEQSAEADVIDAYRKVNAKDFAGARAALGKVQQGLLLSDVAQEMLQRIDEMEQQQRKDEVKKLSDRLSDEAKEEPGAKK